VVEERSCPGNPVRHGGKVNRAIGREVGLSATRTDEILENFARGGELGDLLVLFLRQGKGIKILIFILNLVEPARLGFGVSSKEERVGEIGIGGGGKVKC